MMVDFDYLYLLFIQVLLPVAAYTAGLIFAFILVLVVGESLFHAVNGSKKS